MTLPAAVPELPSTDIARSCTYYLNALGFKVDWEDKQGSIAGISRGKCRLFLTDGSFRQSHGNTGPVIFWLNLESRSEVDDLHAEWDAAGATLLSAPEDKPMNQREFVAADPNGNLIRVFYDFSTG